MNLGPRDAPMSQEDETPVLLGALATDVGRSPNGSKGNSEPEGQQRCMVKQLLANAQTINVMAAARHTTIISCSTARRPARMTSTKQSQATSSNGERGERGWDHHVHVCDQGLKGMTTDHDKINSGNLRLGRLLPEDQCFEEFKSPSISTKGMRLMAIQDKEQR